MDQVLAIIPARGGSKGLPRKNIKKMNQKHLIGYTIEAAAKSKYVNRVIVSTENEEIATISKSYGAEIPYLRPRELATDQSPTINTVLHVVNWLEQEERYVPEYIMVLQCTSPLRNEKHIDEALEKLINSGYDALVSVCEVEENPYWTNVFEGDTLKYFIEEGRTITKRQDLPKVYAMNGAIYIIKTKALIEFKSLEIDNITGYIMDKYSSIDIDTELDFNIAEMILKNKGENQYENF